MRAIVGIVAATALIGVAGCSSSGQNNTERPGVSPSATASVPASKDAAAQVVITIKDFKYAGPASVSPGSEITVKNEDTSAHTVTADQGDAFDVTVAPGASETFTAPDKSGEFSFHCTYHSNMHGTLVVS